MHLRRAILSLAVALALAGCVEPSDRRPGLALSGELVAFPEDWSFTDAHREIAIQVRTPYLVPHSVTIWCAARDGMLYLAARNPEEKRWPEWTDRHPDVRLRIGEKLYDVRLEPVEAPDQIEAIRSAYAAKYALPTPPPGQAPPMRYWSVVRRDA